MRKAILSSIFLFEIITKMIYLFLFFVIDLFYYISFYNIYLILYNNKYRFFNII